MSKRTIDDIHAAVHDAWRELSAILPNLAYGDVVVLRAFSTGETLLTLADLQFFATGRFTRAVTVSDLPPVSLLYRMQRLGALARAGDIHGVADLDQTITCSPQSGTRLSLADLLRLIDHEATSALKAKP